MKKNDSLSMYIAPVLVASVLAAPISLLYTGEIILLNKIKLIL